jgi:hypothetical protein
MSSEGPPLETLTRRLADCPAEFLAEPRIGNKGLVNVAAVVADLLHELGSNPSAVDLMPFDGKYATQSRNRLRLTLITAWLLHDRWFTERIDIAEQVLEFLSSGLNELAEHTQAQKIVINPDRREELARLCLKCLGLRPAGESDAQAQDRLATLNTAERQRVIKATRAAEERAQEIRRKMAEEAARRAESKPYPE